MFRVVFWGDFLNPTDGRPVVEEEGSPPCPGWGGSQELSSVLNPQRAQSHLAATESAHAVWRKSTRLHQKHK